MKYELTIAHRVCPALAKTAAVYADKFEMVKATTASLAGALEGIRVRLVVILDGCDERYEQLFDAIFAEKSSNIDYKRISTAAIGNHATYARQLEILSDAAADSECLYFSEDDYIYQPNAFKAMMSFLREPEVDIVTPLDHPDGYQRDRENYLRCAIRVSKDCHWREIGSTCCTFMLKAQTLLRARPSLAYYADGGSDFIMGLLLTKFGCYSISSVLGGLLRYLFVRPRNWMMVIPVLAWFKLGPRLVLAPRFRMWSPIPSLAVHLCKPSLPPTISV